MAYPYYGNYMPSYYQPMQNMIQPMNQAMQMNQPAIPQNNQQFQPTTQTASPIQPTNQNQPGIIWVPSEQAANEYLVAPNNAVALWDSNNPVIYLKQADASGKPHMTVYDLVERTQAPRAPVSAQKAPAVEYVTRDQFDALAAKANAMEAKLEALSAPKTAKKSAPKEDVNDG